MKSPKPASSRTEFEYFVTGATDEDGLLVSPRSHPFDVYRIETVLAGPFTAIQRVFFWEPNDQIWQSATLSRKTDLFDDLCASGAWIRQLRDPDEYSRVVPNYDKEKFGA